MNKVKAVALIVVGLIVVAMVIVPVVMAQPASRIVKAVLRVEVGC